MDNNNFESIIEAILFVSADPISIKDISECLEIDLNFCENILNNMFEKYKDQSRGITILKLDDKIQLVTKKENEKYVKKVVEVKNKSSLSSASLEVLSIIAYNQPVTKNFIEQIRAIDSSHIVNNLIKKNLIEEAGRLDIPGKPISYKTTLHFLRCFDITSLEDLPDLPNEYLENDKK